MNLSDRFYEEAGTPSTRRSEAVARNRPMFLERRTDRGWIIGCDCLDGGCFAVKRLGIGVECPRCGRTALSADLTTEYWQTASGDKPAIAA